MFFTAEHRKVIRLFWPNRWEEYLSVLEHLSDFVEKTILPTAKEIDGRSLFPKENLRGLFNQGLTSMSFPQEYGGLELPYPLYAMAIELVAKACASTAISISIHGTVCEGIEMFGSELLKEKYLKPLVKGEKLGAFALTESGSGSDAKAMTTKAELAGDHYVLNGSKMFITNGGEADVYFVFARSNRGHAALVVEKGFEGIEVGENIAKMGLRGSKLTPIRFDGCMVPRENLVGVDGRAFEYAKSMLNGGRITVAAIAVGIAQIAYEKSLKYSRERVQFGQPIANFQMIQEKLANMQIGINGARLLTLHAAAMRDAGIDFASEAAQAKVFASETALRVCNDAIQIHGGYGYADEYDVHRHWRDAKLTTIGEGTSEILRLLVARLALKAAP